MEILSPLSSTQKHPDPCCTRHCKTQVPAPEIFACGGQQYRPRFIESFLWHQGAGASCSLRDLHILTGPCFHGVHLECLRCLHAHIHRHAGALLQGRAHLLGVTAERKFDILSQQRPREPRAKEIKSYFMMKKVKSNLGELLHGGLWLCKPPGAAERLLESCMIGLYAFLLKNSGLLHYSTQLCPQVLFFRP